MAGSVVPWHEYSGRDAEDLIAALLVRTVPGAQRIDGSGGDDGVDVRSPLGEGYRIYQIKGFHGRLTASQKRQISRSLASADKLQPKMVRWTLVLPVDLSPAEDRWFSESLGRQTGVPVDWIGRTQIEEALSNNRDLLRAFAPGSTERRAMDLLGEYNAEAAAMTGGMVDAIDRLARLKSQIDLTDPGWAFDFKVAGRDIGVELRPKDIESALRKPISMSLEYSANDAAVARQVHQFMRYGRPVQIPSENIVSFKADLPGNLAEVLQQNGRPPTVSLAKSDEEKAWRLTQRVEAVRDGRVIGTLPVEWNDRSTGPLGGTWLSGRDRSGFLELTMTSEPDRKGGIQVRAPASDDVLPEDAVPVLRFLNLLRNGDRLRMIAPGYPPLELRIAGDPASDVGTFEDQIAIAEALARIQSAAGVRFPLPKSWEAKDGEMIYFWDQILSVGLVQWYWPGYSVNLPTETVAKLLRDAALPRVSMTGRSDKDPIIQLLKQDIQLQGQMRCEITDMLVANPRTLRKHVKDLSPRTIVPVPLSQDARTVCMFYLDR